MYCEVQQVREADKDDLTNDISDRELENIIISADSYINHLTGRDFTNDVPIPISQASIYLTLYLLKQEPTTISKDIKRMKSGTDEIEYSTSSPTQESPIPQYIMMLLQPYIKQKSSSKFMGRV